MPRGILGRWRPAQIQFNRRIGGKIKFRIDIVWPPSFRPSMGEVMRPRTGDRTGDEGVNEAWVKAEVTRFVKKIGRVVRWRRGQRMVLLKASFRRAEMYSGRSRTGPW